LIQVVGLTGGIGTGKSTVSRMLAELGAPIIDADLLAREVVAPGQPALAQIAQRFPGVVENGQLDRKKLGARVFSDPNERAALNAILHPTIHALFESRVKELAARGAAVAIYDVPLLFENKLEKTLDGVIVVSAPREQQLQRLQTRDGLSAPEANARIDAQLPLAQKVAQATWVVDNSRSLDDTREQVKKIWEALVARGKGP
jgi:dephospho-CoA kinase